MGAHAPANGGRRPAEIVTTSSNNRRVALAQALLVTFLWSTSWILIKFGVNDLALPPLWFAGLRYALAAIVLIAVALPALRRTIGEGIDRRSLLGVAILGLLLYAVTQGAQFAALVHLPAVAVSLALTATPVLVAFASLRGTEAPSPAQIGGTFAVLAGAALYFGPLELGTTAVIGLVIAIVGVGANAASALVGRRIARDTLPHVGGVVGMTALSMAVGAVALVVAGALTEPLPPITFPVLAVITWLALVNTAFAFTLWNHTLRTLTAVESSVMNNLMLVQIAALAWLFLGETLDGWQLAGLTVALAGVAAVQLLGRRRHPAQVAADHGPHAGAPSA